MIFTNLKALLRGILSISMIAAVAGCMGSSGAGGSGSGSGSGVAEDPVIIADEEAPEAPDAPSPSDASTSDPTSGMPNGGSGVAIVPDVITVDVTGGTYVPSDFIPTAVQRGDIDQIIFDDSGIILLPRSVLSDALNEPGAIRQLLLDGSGIDFPQAANWTFQVLDNSDTISQLLYIRFRFFLPPWSPYANIVVGDEASFIEQFIDRYFGSLDPDSNTGDVVSDILTSSSSVTAVSTSGTNY